MSNKYVSPEKILEYVLKALDKKARAAQRPINAAPRVFSNTVQLKQWAPSPGTRALVGSVEHVFKGGVWREVNTHRSASLLFKSPYTQYINNENALLQRRGDTVTLAGVARVNGSSNIITSNSLLSSALPAWARPTRPAYEISQGSGDSRWLLVVATSGNVYAERYYPASTSSNLWMPFSITYAADPITL